MSVINLMRATLIADGSFTYWTSEQFDSTMTDHPAGLNPVDYADFVVTAERPGETIVSPPVNVLSTFAAIVTTPPANALLQPIAFTPVAP